MLVRATCFICDMGGAKARLVAKHAGALTAAWLLRLSWCSCKLQSMPCYWFQSEADVAHFKACMHLPGNPWCEPNSLIA
jgi:hypothetical protein